MRLLLLLPAAAGSTPPVLLLLLTPSQSVADMLEIDRDWLRIGLLGAGKTSMSFVKSWLLLLLLTPPPAAATLPGPILAPAV